MCNSRFKPEKTGFLVKGKNGMKIAVCPDCHGLIVLNGRKYDVDIMVVPVKKPSLAEALENNVYVCPSKYIRKNPKFIAFYLGGNTKAITHLAKVKQVQDNVPADLIVKKQNLREAHVDRWKKYQIYKLFKLGNMMELVKPIKRENFPSIQNRVYVDFQTFSKAKKLRELFR